MTGAHCRLKSREELVENLLAELAISDDRREDLMVAIERDQRIISTSHSIAHARSSEQLRSYLKKYYKVLRKVRALTDGLGVRDRSLVFGGLPAAVTANSGRFLAEVDRLIDAAECYLTNPLADSEGRRWDALKYLRRFEHIAWSRSFLTGRHRERVAV
jgi:hypothetical protein